MTASVRKAFKVAEARRRLRETLQLDVPSMVVLPIDAPIDVHAVTDEKAVSRR